MARKSMETKSVHCCPGLDCPSARRQCPLRANGKTPELTVVSRNSVEHICDGSCELFHPTGEHPDGQEDLSIELADGFQELLEGFMDPPAISENVVPINGRPRPVPILEDMSYEMEYNDVTGRLVRQVDR